MRWPVMRSARACSERCVRLRSSLIVDCRLAGGAESNTCSGISGSDARAPSTPSSTAGRTSASSKASSHPEELVAHGLRLGLRGIALTDRDGLYGAVRFAKAAAQLRRVRRALRRRADARVRRAPSRSGAEPRRPGPAKEVPTDTPRLVLIAADKTGYANLARLISTAQLRGRKRDARLRLDDLDGRTAGLIALSGGRNGVVEKALLRRDTDGRGRARRAAARSLPGPLLPRAAAPRAARRSGADPRAGAAGDAARRAVRRDQRRRVRDARRRAAVRRADLREVHDAAAERRDAAAPQPRAPSQNAGADGAAVRRVSARDRATRSRSPNAARSGSTSCAASFRSIPIPADESSAQSYLRTLVYARREGALSRSRSIPRSSASSSTSSGIIARMDLAGYFLVVWDIANAATRLGVLAQGRGSAANSAVCYALGITAVDPVASGLALRALLERGARRGPRHRHRLRASRPREGDPVRLRALRARARGDGGRGDHLPHALGDPRRRQSARAHARPGRRRSCASTTRASRSPARSARARRSAAKPLPQSVAKRRDLDAGSNVVLTRATRPTDERGPRARAGLSRRRRARTLRLRRRSGRSDALRGPVGGELGALLLKICRRIDGFPRHMGIHSGGMVITRSPLVEVAPVEWATMRDRTIVQWDKDDLSDLGLIKIDLLGLGMLSLLRDAFALHRAALSRAAAALARTTIPAGRPPDLRDAAASRLDRRLPGRVARAEVDAAALEAARASTTSSCRSRSSGRARFKAT